jgi:hypothetical protein
MGSSFLRSSTLTNNSKDVSHIAVKTPATTRIEQLDVRLMFKIARTITAHSEPNFHTGEKMAQYNKGDTAEPCTKNGSDAREI